MAKLQSNKHRATRGKSPDPYLRAFLRQAVAIIAAERGLNDVSRAKLRLVAQQLGLSEKAFLAAVEKLKKPSSSLGLNRYEEEFVQFLAKEFKKISGDVLTIKAENKVIDLAEAKYQIDPVRAHQLIQKTADKHNVGTISHHEAEQFAGQLIEEAVNNQTWLREADLERLYRACVKWGLTQNDVDGAIRAHLTRNRRKRQKSMLIALVSTAVLLSLGGAIVLAANKLDWQYYLTFATNDPNDSNSNRNVASRHYPDWWDSELTSAADRLRQNDNRFESLVNRLVESNTNDRASIYHEFAQIALNISGRNSSLELLLVGLFLNEPGDNVADSIIDAMEHSLLAYKSKQIATPSQIRKSLAANRLLGLIRATSVQYPAVSLHRQARIDRLVEQAINIPNVPLLLEDYTAQSVPQLTIDQWNHALRHCNASPEKVAALVPELEKRKELHNDLAINEIRTLVLLSIIEKQPFQWTTLQESIAISIRNSDELKSVGWINVLLNTRLQPFAEFLLYHLGIKFEHDLKDRSESRLQALRQYRSDIKHRGFNSAIAANIKLENKIRIFEQELQNAGYATSSNDFSNINQRQLPQLIANATFTNNLAMAWIRSAETIGDYSTFEVMELRTFPNLSVAADPTERERRTPTPSENRRLQENFDRIFDSQTNQVTARMSAVQTLAKLAPSFRDIKYPNAEKFAVYILQNKEPRESLDVERALPKFSHWAQLKLAIADQVINDKSLRLDTVLSHLNRLESREISLGSQGNWRNALYREILLSVLTEMKSSRAQIAVQAAWDKLESRLLQLYAERALLLGAAPANSNQLSSILLNGLSAAANDQSFGSRINRSLQFIRQQNSDEISKLVLANQLHAEMYNPKPLKLTVLEKHSLNNGLRLLASELLLMDVLAEYRNAWLNRVVE